MTIYSLGARRRPRIRVLRRRDFEMAEITPWAVAADQAELADVVEQIRCGAFSLYESVRAIQREVERGRTNVMPALGEAARAAAAVSEDVRLLRIAMSLGDDDGFAVPI